jgi:hypothetical protein
LNDELNQFTYISKLGDPKSVSRSRDTTENHISKTRQDVKTIISNIKKELEVLNAQKTKHEELCRNQNSDDDERNLNTTLLRSINNRIEFLNYDLNQFIYVNDVENLKSVLRSRNPTDRVRRDNIVRTRYKHTMVHI